MDMRGRDVLVMGLGVHGGGLGVVRWLMRQGAAVTVTDMATAEALAEPLALLERAAHDMGTSVRYVLGGHRAEDFSSHPFVVVNPAVRPDSPWLIMARQAGAQIETEMTLFFRHCPAPIVGITGTKGKTTTTLLTGAMLRQLFPETVIAGNLRVSALAALDQITEQTPVVLELSSFQLVGLGEAGLSPQYAAVTNLSPDHLNYHGSLGEYAYAKQQIYQHQAAGGVVVLNQDLLDHPLDDLTWDIPASSQLCTFSLHHDRMADCRITQHNEIVCDQTYICTVADVALPGRHNLENVLAAVALAYRFGIAPEALRTAIRMFQGVEHRLESVAMLDGVQYVNDTTATNPAAALAALESFTQPLIVLAGGADKDLCFDALARAIAQRVKTLVLLAGSATDTLAQAVQSNASISSTLSILGPYDDFAEAIRTAHASAMPGDVVLLSPGCASFGMFRNEFHRGEEFRRIVTTELTTNRSLPSAFADPRHSAT